MEKGASYWVNRLEAVGVPCAPINSIKSALEEPQILHRQMLRQLSHPLSGAVPQVVSPMHFMEAPLVFERPPPLLGQHTREILLGLGLSVDEIADLKERKVV
jgi:crotonobetainyl-CoA:carnitine CoA-transferase CaiB-like acyl-CoA transferase